MFRTTNHNSGKGRVRRRVTRAVSIVALVAGSLTAVTPTANASSSVLCTGYSTCAGMGYSHFNYPSHSATSYWNQITGPNCTNYVAYRLVTTNGMPNVNQVGWGNANVWGHAAASKTNQTPAVGAVAWWDSNVWPAGAAGHVAYVEKVISPTQVLVSEDNYGRSGARGPFRWRVLTKDSAAGWPSGFIHFKDTVTGPLPGTPSGQYESASSPRAGQINVKGWTVDPDAKNLPTWVDVYVGGPYGTPGVEGHRFAAQNPRPDVAAVYPAYGPNHGLDATFTTTKVGRVGVYVYAINRAGTPGENKLLGTRTVTVG